MKWLASAGYQSDKLPRELEPSLEATAHYTPARPITWANGAHMMVVEVDVETGLVRILQYTTMEDFGPMINPALVTEQVRGAVLRRWTMAIPFSVPSLALPGKVAIITGGGTGMGRSMALEFAKAGADIVVASRTVANLEQVAAEVRALGRRALAIRTDVSRKTDVDRMVAGAMEAFGQVDILVNNAGLGSGIGEDGRGLGHRDPPWLIDIPEDNWDPIIAVNLKGVYLCCAAAGRIMVAQRRGSMINISSRAGAAGAARPYSAAKAGVNRLTAGLARELGPYNVRVNAIAPAYTRTEVGVMQRPSEVAAYDAPETLARYPLGRIAEPIDIACAALFLASDAANGITGQVLNVDCGASA